MNSFCKKIALVCLVSLTANQAAQAFQFPDVWGWMKENPKKSFAIGWMTFGFILLFKHMLAERREAQAVERIRNSSSTTTSPVTTSTALVQFGDAGSYTYTTYAAGWTFFNPAKQQRLCPDAQDWRDLTDAEKAELSKQWQGDWQQWHGPMGKHVYVTVARDKQKKIAGAIFYETTLGVDSPICITHWQGQEGTLKAGLFKPLIKTGRDIKPTYKEGFILGYRYLDVMAEIEADDGLKPRKQFFGISGQEETLFDRSQARAQRLLESGREGSKA